MSEERKEKKGSIALDKHCCVEVSTQALVEGARGVTGLICLMGVIANT